MKQSNCSVRKQLKIIASGRSDYESLAPFHYRDTTLGPMSHIYAIIDQHPRRYSVTSVVGVIVYCSPPPNNATRNLATDGFFTGLDRRSSLALLNQNMRTISRVIIEPRYRGLGLASWLVKETLGQIGVLMIEAISVMGKTHPFLKQAGMCEYARPQDVKTEQMQSALETVGIDESIWADVKTVHEHLEQLEKPRREFIEKHIGNFLQKYRFQRNMEHCFERTDFLLSKLCDPGHYYLWQKQNGECGI